MLWCVVGCWRGSQLGLFSCDTAIVLFNFSPWLSDSSQHHFQPGSSREKWSRTLLRKCTPDNKEFPGRSDEITGWVRGSLRQCSLIPLSSFPATKGKFQGCREALSKWICSASREVFTYLNLPGFLPKDACETDQQSEL